MGTKCCVCLKDKKDPGITNKREPPKEEKAPILDPGDINPVLKPAYNPQSSLSVEQYKSAFLSAISAEKLTEINEILAQNFPINEPISNEKFPALHVACKMGKLSVVSHLIEKNQGISIDLQDENEKWTPLMLAAINGHLEIVEFLLKNKAKTDLFSEENKQAVDYAVQGGYKEIAEVLKKTLPV